MAAGLILLVAACTNGSPAAPPTVIVVTPSRSPITTAVPTETPSLPALARTRVDFTCRLPAYSRDGTQLNDFTIDFPDLAVTPAGQGGYFYDRAVGRWLPVTPQATSPDGLRYAYTEGWSASPAQSPRVHIVDAASGSDVRVVTMPDAQPYAVVDYTSSGVFLMIRYEGTTPGVWKLNPNSGTVTMVSSGLYQRSGPGWIGVVDPRDPSPYRSDSDGTAQPNRIDRRDDAGKIVTWFYQPGEALAWVAFAGPQALLVMGRSRPANLRTERVDYWLVGAPGQATYLAGYSGDEASPYRDLEDGFVSASADVHGIWIGSAASLYLVTPGGRLLRVLDRSAYPAGACV